MAFSQKISVLRQVYTEGHHTSRLRGVALWYHGDEIVERAY